MDKSYVLTYVRDEDGWWVASVPSVKGCHTQGRTIGEARRRIRDALELYIKGADTAELVDDIRMDAALRKALQEAQEARREAEASQALAVAKTATAVAKLGKSMSMRDVADLVGVSHQRVHQLLKATPLKKGARAGR